HMSNEVFFEVRRQKSHYYLDAEEHQTVMDLKRMLAGITKVHSADTMELWKLDEEGGKTQLLHDNAQLSECGYSAQNAKVSFGNFI
uniref:Ubiquitin-like domain-containing protein n=2 Tax=Caenorhabditis japonica TaxID=281687 RepID=A0A8R1IPP0_CAEJA